MNYFLDTNIIIILFEGRKDEIRNNVREILMNEENSFYASTISLLEIAQLYRKKRFKNIDYDPNDLAIIAHAIAENMPIISCDDKFPAYQEQGAIVIHNPR